MLINSIDNIKHERKLFGTLKHNEIKELQQLKKRSYSHRVKK